MKNKDVEAILFECNIQHPLIISYIEQLEKENAYSEQQLQANDQFNVGDIVSMNIDGFMGIEIPSYAKITDIMYNVRAEFNNNQYSEMCLTEYELNRRLLKNED